MRCRGRCPTIQDNSTSCGISSVPRKRIGCTAETPASATTPGMPWAPPDRLGKDHYNRLHLAELAQRSRSDVTAIQQHIDRLMAEPHVDDGAVYALQSQLVAARRHLAGYQAVQDSLNSAGGPKRYLGVLDELGHGAVAVANPDTARRNAIYVPGTGQDLSRLAFSDDKALAMHTAALAAEPNLQPGDVSVTTWMGYDRPMDLSRAAFPQPAHSGAGRLDTFENGQRASHVGAAFGRHRDRPQLWLDRGRRRQPLRGDISTPTTSSRSEARACWSIAPAG